MYRNVALVLVLTAFVQSAVALSCSEKYSCVELVLLSLGPVALVLLLVLGLVCRRCCSQCDCDEESQYSLVGGNTVVLIRSDETTQASTSFTGLHTTDHHHENVSHLRGCRHHDDFPSYEDFCNHENFTVQSNCLRDKQEIHEDHAVKTAEGDHGCQNNTCGVQSTSFQGPRSNGSEHDQSLVKSTYNINGVGKVVLRRPAEQLQRLTKVGPGKASFVPTLASIEERASEEGWVSSGEAGGAQSNAGLGEKTQTLEEERRRANTIEKESESYTTQDGTEVDTIKERRKTGPAEEEEKIVVQANEGPHLEPLTRMCRTPKHFHKAMLDLSNTS